MVLLIHIAQAGTHQVGHRSGRDHPYRARLPAADDSGQRRARAATRLALTGHRPPLLARPQKRTLPTAGVARERVSAHLLEELQRDVSINAAGCSPYTSAGTK
jgi:hypothetical protein